MLGQPLTPALALLVAPVPLRGLILMLLLQVPARAGGTACGGACALENRGEWSVESCEEPPVAFGGQYHFVAPVRLRRASSASRADLDALDLNPRLSGGDRLRWGVCS